MTHNSTVTILLVFLFLPTSFVVGGELYDAYDKDYEHFWDKWHTISKAVKSCEDEKAVISFLKDAIILSNNDDLIQANADIIETLANSNIECLVNALNQLSDKELKEAMRIYVANPYGMALEVEIESLLRPYFKNEKYARIKKYFYSEKKW